MKVLLVVLMNVGFVASASASALCDISNLVGTEVQYRHLLETESSSSSLTLIEVGDINKDVQACIAEVDLGFELGDGYYDVQSRELFMVPSVDGQSRAGYLVKYGVTDTEGDDPSAVREYVIRFNDKGQRVSQPGRYE